ncbi:MAG: hypothetical protein ACFCUQ_02920 [Kiloniellales bacterium]
MLHTDIPSETELRELNAFRGGICVSLYLPTTPVTRAAKGDCILFKNLATKAIGQLKDAKANKRKVASIEASLMELHDDDLFWAYLADGLAVFATPEEVRTFRLPIAPAQAAEVSDRFHVKPLVPLLAFPGASFVLALSQGATRFIEVTSAFAGRVKVDDLPRNMSDAVRRQLPRDRAPSGRIQGSEGMRVLTGQYCRIVDRALRPILTGLRVPLILASVGELAAIYRMHNSYPHLLKSVIAGNPEQTSEAELAKKARDMARRHARKVIRERLMQVEHRAGDALASTDVAEIARAAVKGGIATLLVDVAAPHPGAVDPETGAIKLATRSGADTYDVIDELVGLTLGAGGEVLPLGAASLPNGSPAAATFRFRL